MRKNSVKNTRINGEVQRVLAEVIRGEIKDPRIAPMTSVVAVEVARKGIYAGSSREPSISAIRRRFISLWISPSHTG